MIQFIRKAGYVFIAIGLLASCDNKNAAKQAPVLPPVPVVVYTVQQGASSYYDLYPATVTPLNQVDIRPQVSGYITGIYFKDGQHISKGQKLYTIDQQQYQAGYDQSVANLNVAKANLAKAQQDADRYLDLAKNDAIAKQTLDHALADLQTAKMQVEAAKANVSSVQTNLRYSNIYAPFDGTIGISQVKLGAAVLPGQTLLNTLSSDNPIAVDFNVDEKQLPRFVQLQQKGSNAADSTFSILLPDQSTYKSYGHIAFIDRAIDPQTGTIKTRLLFDNAGNLLRSGLSCTVRVLNDGNSQQILIPNKAVVEQMGEYFVYVVGDSSKVSQRKVSLGTTVNASIVVKDGLQQGQQVVIEGVQKLRDGSKVVIGAPGAAGAKTK